MGLAASAEFAPQVRRWTRDQYYRMAALGWFEGQKTELIDGEVVLMSPKKFSHSATVDRIAELLRSAAGGRFWVRSQLPIVVGETNEPDPDVSVVAGVRADYSDHPTAAELIIEVSDSTLAYDRRVKSSLYARTATPEYWIIDLAGRAVEVYRVPTVDPACPHGF